MIHMLEKPMAFTVIESNSIGVKAVLTIERRASTKEFPEAVIEATEVIYKVHGTDDWKYFQTGRDVGCSDWCNARLFEHDFDKA